ncbi:hypothetical protein MAH1_02450 [Sessilibacter sp. MAH1]
MDSQLSIVLVSYNSGGVIDRCLGDLIRSQAFPIIVVDNNSSDNTPAYLRDSYPNLTVIDAGYNIGYGGAANIGMKACQTPFVLLLNPDVIVTADEITQFFTVAYNHRSENNELDWTVFAPATGAKSFKKQGILEVSNVLGAVMLFNMQKLNSIGLFDERYFMFYEEKDLCLRIIKAGEKILLDSDILFEHDKGTSSGSSNKIYYLKQWHVAWSSMYYFEKHFPNPQKKARSLLARYRFKAYFSLKKQARIKFKARLNGLKEYLSGRDCRNEDRTPKGFDRVA